MKNKISTIINFCSNDWRFIDKCLKEVKHFSDEVLVVTCDHFFDGMEENRSLLNSIYNKYTDVSFVEYSYSPDQLYTPFIESNKGDDNWQMYWYGTSRYLGYLYSTADSSYLLFLDVDEIVDGKRFLHWLDSEEYKQYDAMRLLSYFYFRKPFLQATLWPPNAFLVKRDAINPHFLINDWDRKGAYSRIQGNKNEGILGIDNKPLVHHYSWVKTKEECHKKAKTSGHWWEKDWKSLIEKEFSKEFQGTDFAFSYDYETAPLFFDPFSIPPFKSENEENQKHVRKITRLDASKKELELSFLAD